MREKIGSASFDLVKSDPRHLAPDKKYPVSKLSGSNITDRLKYLFDLKIFELWNFVVL